MAFLASYRDLPIENLVGMSFFLEIRRYEAKGIDGENRVLRGGSWNNEERNCGVAIRNNNTPDNRNHNYGFRLSNTIFVSSAGFMDPVGVH